MSPQTFVEVTLWLVTQLDGGSNIRSDLGDEQELRRLGESLKKRQDYPLLILADGTVVDGHRRLAAARLVGLTQLACIVIPPGTSPADRRLIQWRCAVHRKGISAHDTAVAIRDTKAELPGITNKALAEDILDIDPSGVTQYLSLFDCIPEVQQAAKEGRIGLMTWYRISTAKDQAEALAKALNRSTRAATAGRSRIEIPVSSNGRGNVIVAGQGADDLSVVEGLLQKAVDTVKLPRFKVSRDDDEMTLTVTQAEPDIAAADLEPLLKEAIKTIKAAIAGKHTAKSLKTSWRDQANGT